MASLEDLNTQVGPGQYDAVVRIDFFENVYQQDIGWPLVINDAMLQSLDCFYGVRVVPIGHFNAGKTWLLKKLCEGSAKNADELTPAHDKHTEGFSLKLATLKDQTRPVALLDTAGLNSPVTSLAALGKVLRTAAGSSGAMTPEAKLKAMDGMLQELKRHETFVKQVSFKFAQVFLVVVGQISHGDQIQLLNLIEEAERCPTAKQVIVVHNLKTTTYAKFGEEDMNTGDTYLESMEKVFKLEAKKVQMSNEGSEVPELFGAFGVTRVGNAPASKVSIRHLFLLKDDPADQAARHHNECTLQRLRQVIMLQPAKQSSLLSELGRIMTQEAASKVRLPPGKVVEIRAHRSRRIMVAGEVKAEEIKKLAETKDTVDDDPAVKQAQDVCAEAQKTLDAARKTLDEQGADGADTAAAKQAFEGAQAAFADAEEAFAQATAEAASRTEAPVLDAATLLPLQSDMPVTAKPVPLGGVAASTVPTSKHVLYNVTRVRGFAAGIPHWLTSVNLTLPGLAAGELESIREQLAWYKGAEMASPAPAAELALQLKFTAKMLAVPEKQLASLNAAAQAAGGSRLAIPTGDGDDATNKPRTSITVVDAGTRPFPTAAAVAGAANAHEVSVTLQTEVTGCLGDVEPVVTYARGILSVTVVCALSDEDLQREPPSWTQAADAQHVELATWNKGDHGSDDDQA